MASDAGLSLSAEAAPADSRPAGYPFRGYGPLARVAPFAVVAILAEASLALPPGPGSAWATAVSVVLLLAVPASFLLPWPRLPAPGRSRCASRAASRAADERTSKEVTGRERRRRHSRTAVAAPVAA
jgi:hypothetical protein